VKTNTDKRIPSPTHQSS